MQNLFRGYLPTKEKRPTLKFDNPLTLTEAKKYEEYAGILADNVILIDVDNYEQSELLMDIVEDLQLNCRVLATNRGKHFYFYGGNVNSCCTHKKSALGIEVDIKTGDKTTGLLKYGGVEREVIYDIEPHEEYDPLPEWLRPVRSNIDFTDLAEGDGRNQTLFNYILTLQSAEISNEDIKTTIRLINDYVLPEPLEEDELNKILRDESFQKPVFYGKNGNFLFDKFANFLKVNYHIIRIHGQLHIYKDGIYEDGLEPIERQMVALIPSLTDRNRKEVIKYLKLIAPEVREQSGAHYIAFKNGIFNTDTGQLEEFKPEVVVKNKIPFNYNADAYNETLDAVLDRISCHDEKIRDLLEEMAGYCMYRRNELRKAFILIGDKANGKSTYLDCISYMLGERNTAALDLKELGDRFRTAELFGKLVNVGDDIGDEFIANPAIFKKVVSGDRITAERKGQDPFDFCNYSKLLFSANNIPRMKDKTGAVLDRMVIVPFNATFSKSDPDYDPHIKYKLRSESAMEYLIKLGLNALNRVLDVNGFTICEKVQAELNEYNEQNNPVVTFFKELDVETDVINQPLRDVYLQYKLYCNEGEFTPMSMIEFGKQIRKEFNLESKQMKVNGRNIKIYRRSEDGN